MRKFIVGAEAPHAKIGWKVGPSLWQKTVQIARNFLKRFTATAPQFRKRPEFTVVRRGKELRLRTVIEGTTFDLLPLAFGIDPKQLHANDRITLDLESWLGVKKARYVGITRGWLDRHDFRWAADGIWGGGHLLVAGPPPEPDYDVPVTKDGLKRLRHWVTAACKKKRRLTPTRKVAAVDKHLENHPKAEEDAFLVVGKGHLDWDLVAPLYRNAAAPISYVPVEAGCLVVFEGDTPIAVIACLDPKRAYRSRGETPFVAPKLKKTSPFGSLAEAVTATMKSAPKMSRRRAAA